MTKKQKRFCEEYLIDLNATQAAIRAGYSERSAGSYGSEIMENPEIRAYIDKAMAARSRRTGINADRVLRELARVAFVRPTDVMDMTDGSIRQDATDDDLAAIASVKVKEMRGDYEGTEREVRFADKLKALELCGKHLGMFGKDGPEILPITVAITYDYGDQEPPLTAVEE